MFFNFVLAPLNTMEKALYKFNIIIIIIILYWHYIDIKLMFTVIIFNIIFDLL